MTPIAPAGRHPMALVALLGVMVLSAIAAAQQRRGQQANPAAPRPIITRHEINNRNWTLTSDFRIHGFQSRGTGHNDVRATSRVALDSVQFFYPVLTGSSMHEVRGDRARGEVRVNGRVISSTLRLESGFQAGTRLGVLDVGAIRTSRISIMFEIPMTSFETRIDEARAREIRWPTNPWPAEIASALEPQLFVEVNSPEVQELVRTWVTGNPRSTIPYDLAKFLAGRVVEHVQPGEGDFESLGRGNARIVMIDGARVRGAAHAAATGRGSIHDPACLLTAVYRAAGIPARLVIGYDKGRADELRTSLPLLHSWVEFYLWDEPNQVGEWIPVDILRQRKFSSRPPPITQRWDFFGHNEEFDFVVPIAHHWIPPAGVTNAGPPALWGWIPVPGVPFVDSDFRLRAMETPIRGDDPDLRRDRRRP